MNLDIIKEEIAQLRSKYGFVSALVSIVFGWVLHNIKIFSNAEIITGFLSIMSLYLVLDLIEKDIIFTINKLKLLNKKN